MVPSGTSDYGTSNRSHSSSVPGRLRVWLFLIKTEVVIQSSVALYTERDQLGVMKRSAAKPNMKRFSSEAFSEKELLILAILCLYRIDSLFFPILKTVPDSREWFEDICVLVRDPGRTLLPLASLRAYTSQAEWMLGHAPGTRYHESVSFWLGLTV